MTDAMYNNTTFRADAVNGHFTAQGYEFMAECYLRVLSDVINDNVSDAPRVTRGFMLLPSEQLL